MHISADETKFEIDVTWVERIAHTANEICDKSDYDRIKMNEQHTGFIIEYNDAEHWAVLVGKLSGTY